MTARRLAIIVASCADHTDLPRAAALALASRGANTEVALFFMADAVAELPAHRELISELVEQGCDVIACAHSAHQRGLSEAEVGMLLGSQDDHAAIVHRADRVVAFT